MVSNVDAMVGNNEVRVLYDGHTGSRSITLKGSAELDYKS